MNITILSSSIKIWVIKTHILNYSNLGLFINTCKEPDGVVDLTFENTIFDSLFTIVVLLLEELSFVIISVEALLFTERSTVIVNPFGSNAPIYLNCEIWDGRVNLSFVLMNMSYGEEKGKFICSWCLGINDD